MTGLLELFGPDRTIRVDMIRSIGPAQEKNNSSAGGRTWMTEEHAVTIEYLGESGDRYTRQMSLHTSEVERVMRRPMQLIPPALGTSIVRGGMFEGAMEIWSTPVIAWALCLDGEVRPVTTSGVNDGLDENSVRGIFVEMPCGKVEGVGEHTEPCFYENREEMRADLLARLTTESE